MNVFTMIKTTISAITVSLAMVAVSAAAASAADANSSLEALAATLAQTPQQHAVLASYYRDRAAEARAEAAKHESMKAAYMSHKPVAAAAMANHCDGLIKSYTQAAVEFEALAKEHEAPAAAVE